MGGDILTFVSPPGSSNREGHYSYLSLPLWHSETFVRFPQKKKSSPCHAVWMNTSWLQVCVSVTLPHRGCCQIIVFPFFSSPHPPPSSFICLPGTLMILKSACSYNASYIDRLISVFMRSLQKMVREHLSPQQANPGVTETSTGMCMDINSVERTGTHIYSIPLYNNIKNDYIQTHLDKCVRKGCTVYV